MGGAELICPSAERGSRSRARSPSDNIPTACRFASTTGGGEDVDERAERDIDREIPGHHVPDDALGLVLDVTLAVAGAVTRGGLHPLLEVFRGVGEAREDSAKLPEQADARVVAAEILAKRSRELGGDGGASRAQLGKGLLSIGKRGVRPRGENTLLGGGQAVKLGQWSSGRSFQCPGG